MFNSFKRKVVVMACMLLVAIVLPMSLSAQEGAAFTSFSVDRTTVAAGQSVTFSIRTTGANFVFAVVGGNPIQATQIAQDTWNLTVLPAYPQTIIVYANTVNAIEGAATVSIPVAVGAGTAHVTPGVTGGQHRIYSITETTATAVGEVVLTVVTDAAAGSVWVSQNNRYFQGRQISQTGTQRTWEVAYRPQQNVRHNVQVSANHSYVLDTLMASQTFDVRLVAPFVPPTRPEIRSVSPTSRTIDDRERLNINVRTNLDVEHVWAMVDGSRVNARRGTSTATLRNWTIEIRPDRTQDVWVYANYTNDTSGAVRERVRVTVRDRWESDARIDRVRVNGQSSNVRVGSNEWVDIEVRTSDSVTHVWARVNGEWRSMSRGSRIGDLREWTLSDRIDYTQRIDITANTSNNRTGSGAEHSSIQVTVDW